MEFPGNPGRGVVACASSSRLLRRTRWHQMLETVVDCILLLRLLRAVLRVFVELLHVVRLHPDAWPAQTVERTAEGGG